MYYLINHQLVKTPEGVLVTRFLEITNDGETNILLRNQKEVVDVNGCYYFNVDNGALRKYSGELLIKRGQDPYRTDKSNNSNRPNYTTEYGAFTYDYKLPSEIKGVIEDKLSMVLCAIISQPELKVDKVEKTLGALGFKLNYKPFKLLISKGWKAKNIQNPEEIEPFSHLLLDLISQT